MILETFYNHARYCFRFDGSAYQYSLISIEGKTSLEINQNCKTLAQLDKFKNKTEVKRNALNEVKNQLALTLEWKKEDEKGNEDVKKIISFVEIFNILEDSRDYLTNIIQSGYICSL